MVAMIVGPMLVVLVVTVVPLVLSSSSGMSYADRLIHRRNGSDLCFWFAYYLHIAEPRGKGSEERRKRLMRGRRAEEK